jgi:cardiolipin synthase
VNTNKIKNTFYYWYKNIMAYTWWELTIFITGLISFIAVLVVLFLPFGDGPSKFTLSGTMPSVSDPKFVAMISNSLVLPVRQGDSIEIINNGDAFLKSFLTDIDNAKTSINIMVYIWTDGAMSDQVLEHLDKKLKEGVQVRIMIDAFGSDTNTPNDKFNLFKNLGGKLSVFHSFTIVPWNILKNQARNHRRAIIIDGKIGYTGGMTISDPWLGNARNTKEYRDTMFRTTGAMTQDMQGIFSELWASMTGEILTGENFYFPQKVENKKDSITYVALASTPSPDSLTISKFFLLSVMAAKQTIYITTPYFLPDASLSDALITKAKEGVDVRILVPNILNDVRSAYYASHYYYENLLDGGVKIYEYQPTFIHSKSIIIDSLWSVIGSANLDNHSRQFNEEDIFGVSDKSFGTALENIFLEDLTNAKQINLVDWKKRSVWQHIREIFDLKFIKQY